MKPRSLSAVAWECIAGTLTSPMLWESTKVVKVSLVFHLLRRLISGVTVRLPAFSNTAS